MKILHKSLPIAFLAVSIFVSGFNLDLSSAQNTESDPMVSLSHKEKAWLDKHPVLRVGLANNSLPLSTVDENGKPHGMLADYFRLLGENTGLDIEFLPMTFSEVLTAARQRKIDLYSSFLTPERMEYTFFSEPLFALPLVITTHQDMPFIAGLGALHGRKAAVYLNSTPHRYLEKAEPQIKYVPMNSVLEALRAVSEGHVDAFLGNMLTAGELINREGLVNLKFAASFSVPGNDMRIGVRNDWPEMASIINKVIASIPPEQHSAIYNKWVSVRYDQVISWKRVWTWVGAISGVLCLILAITLFWVWRLSKEISFRKIAENSAKQAKQEAEAANRAKSIFLANMSHELRTPLNAILGFSGMLSRDEGTTPNQQEKLSIINRSGQHLLSMINGVLDLSKIESGRVELEEHPFDLVALIREISVMIQSRATVKGILVAVESDAVGFPDLKADVGKLRQILINLLSNAVKFTDEGGVTIRSTTVPIPEEPKRCHLVIEVEDTGPGIEPARQAQIFEPFVQGIDLPERKGTGLGLSICKRYANIMGGTIEMESEVGKGSLFRVRLPAEIVEAADVKMPVDDRPSVIGLASGQKTWRILVADDNRANLLLLKSLLEAVGFFVLEAKNGKEAVEAFNKDLPDLIWMDMRMPVMDGYEAVRQIRRLPGGDRIPIIAITASAFSEQRPDILAAGCDDIVFKPFRTHEIFETMGRFLDLMYIYEPEGEAAPVREHEVEITSVMLADLPEDLLQELRKNSLSADREAISDVIDRIKPLAPDTAKILRDLLDDFQIARIHELLEKIK